MALQNIMVQDTAFNEDTSKTTHAWQQGRKDEESGSEFKYLHNIGKILDRLHFSMAIFGLYHFTSDKSTKTEANNRILPNKSALYNIFIIIVLWMVFARSVLSWIFVKEDSDYPMVRILPLAWGFQVAVNGLIMFKASHPRFGNAMECYFIWREKIVPVLTELKVDVQSKNTNRHLMIIIFIGWTLAIINSCVFSFLMFFPFTSYGEYVPKLLISPLPINTVTKVIIVVTGVYTSVAWVMPMVHAITVCILMQYVFKACSEAVKQTAKNVDDDKVFPGSLHRQRLMHLNACEAVELFDKDLNYFFANMCFTYIPLACLYLYQLFQNEMDSLTRVFHAAFLVVLLLMLKVVCTYAAIMNKAAHAPLQHIYRTGMEGVSLEQLGQVGFFVSKLTASPIGFTVLNFVVITKELILTVGGIFLTYSFVLLQF